MFCRRSKLSPSPSIYMEEETENDLNNLEEKDTVGENKDKESTSSTSYKTCNMFGPVVEIFPFSSTICEELKKELPSIPNQTIKAEHAQVIEFSADAITEEIHQCEEAILIFKRKKNSIREIGSNPWNNENPIKRMVDEEASFQVALLKIKEQQEQQQQSQDRDYCTEFSELSPSDVKEETKKKLIFICKSKLNKIICKSIEEQIARFGVLENIKKSKSSRDSDSSEGRIVEYSLIKNADDNKVLINHFHRESVDKESIRIYTIDVFLDDSDKKNHTVNYAIWSDLLNGITEFPNQMILLSNSLLRNLISEIIKERLEILTEQNIKYKSGRKKNFFSIFFNCRKMKK